MTLWTIILKVLSSYARVWFYICLHIATSRGRTMSNSYMYHTWKNTWQFSLYSTKTLHYWYIFRYRITHILSPLLCTVVRVYLEYTVGRRFIIGLINYTHVRLSAGLWEDWLRRPPGPATAVHRQRNNLGLLTSI